MIIVKDIIIANVPVFVQGAKFYIIKFVCNVAEGFIL